MTHTARIQIGQGGPVECVNAKGALMLAAIAAYERGNPKGKTMVDRALALAAEKGHTGGADFRAAFQRTPRDQVERVRQVEAVFAVIDDWEFTYGVFGTPVGVRQH